MPRTPVALAALAVAASVAAMAACTQTISITPASPPVSDAGRMPVDLTTSVCSGPAGTEIRSFPAPKDLPLALAGAWATCAVPDGGSAPSAVTASAGLEFEAGYVYPLVDDVNGTATPDVDGASAISVSLAPADAGAPTGYAILDLTANGVSTSYRVDLFTCPSRLRLSNVANPLDVATYAPTTAPPTAPPACASDAAAD